VKSKAQTDSYLTDGFKSSGTSPPLDLAKTSGTSPPETDVAGKLSIPQRSAETTSSNKKVCTVCDNEKPADEFYKKRDGLESCCKSCKKKGNKQKRAAKSKREKPIEESDVTIVINTEKKGDLINVLFDLLKTHQPVVEPVAHDNFSVSELLKSTNTIDALLEVEKKKCVK